MLTPEKIISRATRVVTEQLGIETDAIKAETSLASLGMDSLDHIETVMALEDEFCIEIDDDVAETWTTVQQVIDHLVGRAAELS